MTVRHSSSLNLRKIISGPQMWIERKHYIKLKQHKTLISLISLCHQCNAKHVRLSKVRNNRILEPKYLSLFFFSSTELCHADFFLSLSFHTFTPTKTRVNHFYTLYYLHTVLFIHHDVYVNYILHSLLPGKTYV